MDLFSGAILILSLVMLLRNSLVYRAKMAAIEVASAKTKASIYDGTYDMQDYWGDYQGFGSYTLMLFSLTKWKYEHFYPGFTLDK